MPQLTLFESAQLGLMAFVGGLAMDAQLDAIIPTIRESERLKLDGTVTQHEVALLDAFIAQALRDLPPVAEDV